MQERVIGYDVREMWYREPYDFTGEGRYTRLLSVDGSLWGSLFDQGDFPDIPRQDRPQYGLGAVELPPLLIVGVNTPFWNNRAEMQENLKPYVAEAGRLYWIVALTICLEDPERELRARDEWPYWSEPLPDSIQEDWVTLGYDVTNADSASMIASRLAPDAEREDSRLLQRSLNEYLLFPSMAPANEFRMRWDEVSPYEAPHMIYGIRRVKQIRCTAGEEPAKGRRLGEATAE